jgi:hypothetical protein
MAPADRQGSEKQGGGRSTVDASALLSRAEARAAGLRLRPGRECAPNRMPFSDQPGRGTERHQDAVALLQKNLHLDNRRGDLHRRLGELAGSSVGGAAAAADRRN